MSTTDDADFNTFQASMMKPTTKMSKRMMKAYQLTPQENVVPEVQSNSGAAAKKSTGEAQATLTLTPSNDTFQFKKVALIQDVPVKIARLTSPKQPPTEDNLIFDSKVLSRTHAEIVFNGSNITIKDLGSSNGTFVNAERLSAEGVASTQPKELKQGDVLEFGVNILEEDGSLLYRKIVCQVGVDLPQKEVANVDHNQDEAIGANVLSMLQDDFNSAKRQGDTITKLKLALADPDSKQSADKSNEQELQLAQLQKTYDALSQENVQLSLNLKSQQALTQKVQSEGDSRQNELQGKIQALEQEKANVITELSRVREQQKSTSSQQDYSKFQDTITQLQKQLKEQQASYDQQLQALQGQINVAHQELASKNKEAKQVQSSESAKVQEQSAEQSLKIVALQNQCQTLQQELQQARSKDSTQKQHNDELQALQGLMDLKEKESLELQKKLKMYKNQDAEMIELRKKMENQKKDAVPSSGISVVAVLFVAILSAVLSYSATNYEFLMQEVLKLMPKP